MRLGVVAAALSVLAGTACSSSGQAIDAIDFAFADKETLAAPEMMAVGDTVVWFAVGGSVVAVDARTREQRPPVDVPEFVRALATDGNDLWVALDDGTFFRLDYETGSLSDPVTYLRPEESILGSFSIPMVVSDGVIWVALYERIARFDTETGNALPDVDVADAELVAEDGSVWAVSGELLLRIDAASGAIASEVALPGDGHRVAIDGGVVWVTTSEALLRFDAGTLAPIGEAFVLDPDEPLSSLATGGGALWAVRLFDNEVVRIDPATGQITDRYSLKSPYSSQKAELGTARFGAGALWVGSRIGNRGGVILPE